MIKHLTLRNFTVFKEADLRFSPGLNVVIGENGTGKTHLLKISYLLSNAWSNLRKDPNWSKDRLENYLSDRVKHIFKADKIGNLANGDSDGKCSVGLWYYPQGKHTSIGHELDWRFSFTNRSKDKVSIEIDGYYFSDAQNCGKAVYLPSKEVVSFFEGFLSLYEKREVSFDETYKDLSLHLSANKLKNPPKFIKSDLKQLYSDVGGSLRLEGGKFYLVTAGSKPREITLVAEGIRKLATLLHLLENGSLEVGDTLFLDEPESNLNPKLIKDVAAALLLLCQNGIQVVIGTHSLFLLREIEILSTQKPFNSIPQRYFALGKSENGVNVQQGDSVDDINPFVMLDEELAQSDRFMNTGND
jgi:AAA15 family ATPase/GTPase